MLRVGSAVGLALSLAVAPGPSPVARACDPVPVPFQRVVDGAEQIFLVTVATRAMDGPTPMTYTLVVREIYRGEIPDVVRLPTVITVPAPVITACGDVLDVGITTHLVLALSVPAFEGGQVLTVPWILKADGTLVGGFDDGPGSWPDVPTFLAAMEGAPVASVEPTAPPVVVAPDAGVPLASIGILVGVLLGVAIPIVILTVGRRDPPRRVPPPAPPPDA